MGQDAVVDDQPVQQPVRYRDDRVQRGNGHQ
jgi:hypothetical protein